MLKALARRLARQGKHVVLLSLAGLDEGLVGLDDLDRTLDALEHYDRALQLEPHHCPSLSNLARLYKLGGKPAEAEVLLDRCLASDPGFVLALINRGWVRIDAGMCDEARQDLEPLTDRQDAWGEQARVLLEQCP